MFRLRYFRSYNVPVAYVWWIEAATNVRRFFLNNLKTIRFTIANPRQRGDHAAYQGSKLSMLWRFCVVLSDSTYAVRSQANS